MPDVNLSVAGASPINVTIEGAAPNATTITAGATVTVTVTQVGDRGPTGPQGPPGTAIVVGKVQTLTAGSSATVTATTSEDESTVTLDFGLPTGPAGATGATGPAGANGVTPVLAVGTVTTLASTEPATVTAKTASGITTLNFGIPQGPAGSNGTSITLSSANPMNLGSATSGTSTLASRADHVHNVPTISQISGLQAALDAKQPSGSYLTSAVTSLNGLTGGLTLAAGSNVTISASGSKLTIDSSGGVSWANVPACPTTAGSAGQIAYGADGYLYVCIASGSWRRALLSSWTCVNPNATALWFDSDANGTTANSSLWTDINIPSNTASIQVWAIGGGGDGYNGMYGSYSGGGGGVAFLNRTSWSTLQRQFYIDANVSPHPQSRVRFDGGSVNAATGLPGGDANGSVEGVGGGGSTSGSQAGSYYTGANGATGGSMNENHYGGAAGAAATASTPSGCRMPMPNIESIQSHLLTLGKVAVEDCGANAAVGSGGLWANYGMNSLPPGPGGGGAPAQNGGPAALVVVFNPA